LGQAFGPAVLGFILASCMSSSWSWPFNYNLVFYMCFLFTIVNYYWATRLILPPDM